MQKQRRGLNGLCRGVFLVVLTGLSGVAAELQLIGTHPTSPLTAFPAIHVLKAYEGKIYMGYGDWTYYPAVAMVCYDPSNGVFRVEYSAPSDSVGIMRVIGGNLYVPSIDPPHYQGFRDFAVRSQGRWRGQTPVGMAHVFDFTTSNGKDLWFAGSKLQNETPSVDGAVFRSIDGGRSWADMTISPSSIRRYYYCFTLRGKVYVLDTVYDGTTETRTAEAPHSSLLKPTPLGTGTNEIIVALAGASVGDDQRPVDHLFVTFDGAVWRTLRTARDLTLSDDKLYTMEAGGLSVATSISATQITWQRLPFTNVPPAKALEVLDGIVYVGDTQGRLWAGRVDGSPLALPPTTIVNELPDAFGQALSISGNTMAVGAPDFSGTSIMQGQVTIWESADPRSGEWSLAQTIDPPAPSFSGWFGKDVAMADGMLAIVEAGRDLSRQDRGSSAQVHLYQDTGGIWTWRQTLDHRYAHSVAVQSNLLVVGTSTNLSIYNLIDGPEGAAAVLAANFPSALTTYTIYEPTARVALDGDKICYGLAGDFSRWGGPGQVNVYETDEDGIWRLVTRLNQNSPPVPVSSTLRPDAFGYAVAFKNDWMVVGAPRDDRGAMQAGAVYLYQRTVNGGAVSYVLRQTLLAPPCPEPEGNFGSTVALNGSQLVVGSAGVVKGHGAVFVYEFDGGSWVFKGRVASPAGSQSLARVLRAPTPGWLRDASLRARRAISASASRFAGCQKTSRCRAW